MSKIKEATEYLMQEFPTLTKKYCMRCAIVAGLIDEEFPGLDFGFFLDRNELVVLVNNLLHIYLKWDSKWIDIKEIIRKMTRNTDPSDCGVCYEKLTKGTYCKTCGNLTCADCYIRLLRMHRGIIKCPYCRSEVGIIEGVDEFYQFEVELYILNYKSRFDRYRMYDSKPNWKDIEQ